MQFDFIPNLGFNGLNSTLEIAYYPFGICETHLRTSFSAR
jgi:hypothetical protein